MMQPTQGGLRHYRFCRSPKIVVRKFHPVAPDCAQQDIVEALSGEALSDEACQRLPLAREFRRCLSVVACFFNLGEH